MAKRSRIDLSSAQSFVPFELLLQFWAEGIDGAMEAALIDVVDSVQQEAVATTAYGDDTTATRNSTVAYIAVGGGADPPEPEIAQAVANGYRAGSAQDDLPPLPVDGQISLYLYTATDYSFFLNIRNGGETMFTAHAIEHALPDLEAAIEQRLRELIAR